MLSKDFMSHKGKGFTLYEASIYVYKELSGRVSYLGHAYAKTWLTSVGLVRSSHPGVISFI